MSFLWLQNEVVKLPAFITFNKLTVFYLQNNAIKSYTNHYTQCDNCIVCFLYFMYALLKRCS